MGTASTSGRLASSRPRSTRGGRSAPGAARSAACPRTARHETTRSLRCEGPPGVSVDGNSCSVRLGPWHSVTREPARPRGGCRSALELLREAGHEDFRDARGPMGFTQRQAAGKFTRDEADAFVAQLQQAEEAGEPAPRRAADGGGPGAAPGARRAARSRAAAPQGRARAVANRRPRRGGSARAGGAGGNRTPVRRAVEDRYDHSRGLGSTAALPPGRLAPQGGRRRVFPRVSAVFHAVSGLSRRQSSLLLPGCGDQACVPSRVAGALVPPEDQAARAYCSSAVVFVP